MHQATLLSCTLCTLLLFACSEAPPPEAQVEVMAANVDRAAERQVEYGGYLVEIMGCGDCHSPKIMSPQGPIPDPTRLLSGHPAGTPLPPTPKDHAGWVLFSMDQTAIVGPWGTSFAANLTSDATGIGNWSEEQFVRALTQGISKGIEGNRPLLPPMPWQNFRSLKTEDMRAIFAYLRSTRPVENVVPQPLPPVQPAQPGQPG